MRIVSWNIENARPYLEDDSFDTLLKVHQRLGEPEVLCLQQIRVRAQDLGLLQKLTTALPDFHCHLSLNRDMRKGIYRGGRAYGVATFIKRTFGSKAFRFAWDIEGRVIGSSIPALNAVLINVQVVNGTTSRYQDPQTGTKLGSRHHFKREWLNWLMAECETLQAKALRLILIGDWGIARSKLDATPKLRTEAPHALARVLLNDEFIPRLKLVDVFRHLYPEVHAYTWISRRLSFGNAERVDYALIEQALLDKLTAASIESRPELRAISEHAPCSMSLR
jgi:exonuclease III